MRSSNIACITGGSRGIGAATAIGLARDGYDIWLNYRSNHEAAGEVAAKVREFGVQCTLIPFDVVDKSAVDASLTPLLEDDVPYILVNNAGIAKDGLLAMMDEHSWRSVLSTHLDGFYNVTHAMLPLMIRRRRGRIVNMVSTSGQSGVAGQTNYSAAKAGLIGATKALAAEVAKRNILVNAVAPGFIDTEMLEGLPTEKIVQSIPLGRIGSPQDVADMVCFLCSDKASYITGQVFSVNGGIYM